MEFKDKWLEAVDAKNSVLCAGLDPAEEDMGRGKKGLPADADKREWALRYTEAVAPYCAAIKPNSQYWKAPGDNATLIELMELAHSKGMVVIDDSKLADIGSTNDAGIYYASKRADAVTYSPFAGNMLEAKKQADKRGIGLIPMCLMSNPEYELEKKKLIPLREEELDEYEQEDVLILSGQRGLGGEIPSGYYVHQYIYLANTAARNGLDAIVVGAPSENNHIEKSELDTVGVYAAMRTGVLLPGVGEQGGEAEMIWEFFEKNDVIVNVGRSLMLPNGSNSTPAEQEAKAKYFMEMLNEKRAE